MKAKIKYLLTALVLLVAVATGRYSIDMLADGGQSGPKTDAAYEADAGAREEEGLEEETGPKTDKDSEESSKIEEASKEESGSKAEESKETEPEKIKANGQYTSKEEVAAYLNEFGRLPDNFITKEEARELGWDSKKGNLSEVAPGKSIGGSHFGNYEGLLPEGKTYYECDINSDGGYRGAERLVYSEDGCIYYTGDHYKTFELLYGEE